MPHTVCDARDLQPGHLGLASLSSSQTKLVLPVRSGDQAWVLRLPGNSPMPELDFGLRLLTDSPLKVVDLGSDFIFDYDISDIVMPDHELTHATGSLFLNGPNLAICGFISQQFSVNGDNLVAVNLKTGELEKTNLRHLCEVRSWRLYMPSRLPHQPATLLTSWGQVSKTTVSPLRL